MLSHLKKSKENLSQEISSLVYRKYQSPEASFQKIGTEVPLHQTGSLGKDSTVQYQRTITAARSSYFYNLIEESKNNPKCIFDTVTKVTKKQHTPREDEFHFIM
jgi:3'-phosphoadenosine 5'-phosphosulfate sulfotransferase (PAPS reductase)/FAD synthetase